MAHNCAVKVTVADNAAYGCGPWVPGWSLAKAVPGPSPDCSDFRLYQRHTNPAPSHEPGAMYGMCAGPGRAAECRLTQGLHLPGVGRRRRREGP